MVQVYSQMQGKKLSHNFTQDTGESGAGGGDKAKKEFFIMLKHIIHHEGIIILLSCIFIR